ncbi:MAG: biotin/lipoyl-binding protein, partial [Planctomycetaceae bacterium]|nr:biotin/lipoyl-binding protein [Planctomycetaceae bacterium]
MRRTPWIIGLTASALIGVRVIAGEGAPAPPEVISLQKCTIDYERSTLVAPNQNIGRIQECLVRRGDRVKSGQVLGRLFNQDVQAELGSRIAGFESSGILIDRREAALQVERAKLRRIENLRNRDALLTSIQDLQIQQLAVKTAELEL